MRNVKLLLFLVLCSYMVSHAQNFTELIKKVATDREAQAEFGSSVDISGDYAVVGAWLEDKDENGANSLTDAGSAYILKRDEGGVDNWGVLKKIVPSDRESGDVFGRSVAISGAYVVIGAIGENEDEAGMNTLSSAGSAYIFRKDEGGLDNWGQVKKIVAADRGQDDFFGISVAVSGNYVIVGAYQEDEDESGANTLTQSGSVYVFRKDEGGADNFGQIKKIVAADRASGDFFGYSVSISGDHIIVGAFSQNEDESGGNTLSGAGAAYIFRQNEGGADNWGQLKKIVASDRGGGDVFGWNVSISGDYAVVGARDENEDENGGNTLTDAGSAYIFKQNQGGANNWGEVKKIVAADRAEDDGFGTRVAINGDLVLVSTTKESEDENGGNFINSTGSAYIFQKDEGGTDNWGQTQKIVASDRGFDDDFGFDIGMSGTDILISAAYDGEDENGGNFLYRSGSIYFFEPCDLPTVSFTASAATVGNATNFTDASTNVIAGATYEWDFDNDGTVDNTTVGDVSYTYPSAGTYIAQLTITNPGNCPAFSISSVVVGYANNAWEPLGPDDFGGGSGFSSSDANYVAVVIGNNNIPYVTYLNGTAIGNTSLYAAKFENGSWQTLQGEAFSAGHADFASIAIDGNNVPYIAYRDYVNSAKATVHKFDGGWSVVGSAGFSASTANNTEIAINGSNSPYVVYQDVSTGSKARVKQFDGSSWIDVGGSAASGSTAQFTDIAFDSNDVPYIVFKDGGTGDEATVNTLDGGSWVNFGPPGFSTGAVEHTTIAIDQNDVIYVAYRDLANGSGVTVQKWNGSSWITVGSPSFSTGGVANPSIAISNTNVPYVVYRDGTEGNKITVQQFNGSTWVPVGSAGFSNSGVVFPSLAIDNDGTLIVAYGGPGAFSKYYSYSSTPLPVFFQVFTVNKENESAILNWQTTVEQDNKGFHIQRSQNGLAWEDIDFMLGKGTSSELSDYTYIDRTPAKGQNFYRLQQEDYDGSISFSEIRMVFFGENGETVSVYPNPFQDYLTIENGQGRAEIYNLLGVLVDQFQIKNQRHTTNTKKLPQGTYSLVITHDNGKKVSLKIMR